MWWLVLAVANAGVGQCMDLWDEDPQDPSVWQCTYGAAQSGELDAALAFAEQVQATGPITGQAQLTYGNLLMMARDDGALDALLDAADRFSAEGDVGGEVKTRLNLAGEFRHRGQVDDGWAELDAAQTASGEVEPFSSMIRIEKSRWTCDVGGDYAQALRDLHATRPRLTDDSFPGHGKLLIHHVSGCLADRLGRLEEAREHREALIAFTEETGNDMVRAVTLDNMLWTEAMSDSQQPELKRRAEEALAFATDVGHVPTVADLTCLVAALDPTATFTECLRLADEADLDVIRTRAYGMAAERAILANEPEQARAFLDTAAQSLVTYPSLEGRIEWRASEASFADAFSPNSAIAAGEQTLRAIEDLRALQDDALVRSRTVSQWAGLYDVQASRYLQADDQASAISTVERLRGRQVLERLDRAGGTGALVPDGASWAERDVLLERIDGLMASGEDPDRLAELEREEAALRRTLFQSVPAFAQLRSQDVDMAGIQEALAPDEAVVIHVGGSRPWAGVVRHDRVVAVDLPGFVDAVSKAETFSALVAQGDVLAVASARPLGDALMGPVLAELAGVNKLILMPDASLYRLAWAALAPEGQRLGDDYALSFAPSLRSLMHLRGVVATEDALAIVAANPTLSGASAAFRDEASLGPLPSASAEALAVRKRLGDPSALWLDSEATESRVRAASEGSVRLLHLAAHAVVDPIDPERSAVLLGEDDANDGRLQVREVVAMDLTGAIVVLSACRTADGEVHSEGVVGLTDGFLQAGARAVVASLWPLPDAAAADVMQVVHGELADGARLDDALATATRGRAQALGLRVIGDGSVTLPGKGGGLPWLWPAVGGLALVLAAGGVLAMRRS